MKKNIRIIIYNLIILILFFGFFVSTTFFVTKGMDYYIIIALFLLFPLLAFICAFRDHDFSSLICGNFIIYFLIYAVLKAFVVARNTKFYNMLVRMEITDFAVAQKLLLYGLLAFLLGINSLLIYFLKYKWDGVKNKSIVYFGIFSFILSLALLIAIRFV